MVLFNHFSEKERNIIRNVLLDVEGEVIDHTSAEAEDVIRCIDSVRVKYGISCWC